MTHFQTRTIGGLTCSVRQGDENAPCIVLMHGYGANRHDLTPLADEMDVRDATWIFPEGHLDVPIGPHMSGRAWFPIDMAAIEQAMMMGRHRDFSQIMPPGLPEAADRVRGLLKELGRAPSEIFLGGFSQGAMLTAELGLTSAESFKGLLLLSPALVSEARWREQAARHRGLPVFISHGHSDAVLSFADAQRLHELLTAQGLDSEFHPFSGGHEIPNSVIQAAKRFMNEPKVRSMEASSQLPSSL